MIGHLDNGSFVRTAILNDLKRLRVRAVGGGGGGRGLNGVLACEVAGGMRWWRV